MICPHCKADNDKVIETRSSGEDVRRRRECLNCYYRFTTYEYIDKNPVAIVKRDGRREPFKREKLISGIRKACAKRPVSAERIEEIVTKVEENVMQLGQTEISYTVVGDLVMKELSKVDSIAYVRFASVYKEFKEVGEFVKLVSEKNKTL